MDTDRLQPKPYHSMQIYKDEASLAALVARVVLRARDVGQPVVVIAAEPSRQKIVNALKAARVALDGGEGRDVEILDAHQVLAEIMVGNRPDPSLVCGYAASDLHEPVPSVEELQEICDQHNLIERPMN